MIHEHSRLAWRAFDINSRETEILETIEREGVLTDREVCEHLGQQDMNYARPAITGLIEKGILAEYDEKKCRVTKRIVRRVYFGDGTPKARPRTARDIFAEYFKCAEKARSEALYPDDEWAAAAAAVRQVLDLE